VHREELFERERHRVPIPGWHSCAIACIASAGSEISVNSVDQTCSSDAVHGAGCGRLICVLVRPLWSKYITLSSGHDWYMFLNRHAGPVIADALFR
jgi:hypothetical protein